MRLAFALAFVAAPAVADVATAIDSHVMPGYRSLAASTAALEDVAQQGCAEEATKTAFHRAYDDWIAISHISFGPIEDNALTLHMAFWPDPKDNAGKAVGRLSVAQDPVVKDASSFSEVSAAAQGFTALERVLFEAQPDPDYACALTQAIATSLHNNATLMLNEWPAFATLMTTAGEPGNTRFQDRIEVQRALFTAVSTGLEFLHDQRLGRPLGTFDRPRPRRAEARRSARSLRHIELSLVALEDLTNHLADGPIPKTTDAFAAALDRARALDDPALQNVADPGGRFKVEVLQQAVAEVQEAVVKEIGAPLGVTAGFNSLDGD